jgi:hypothetical protein
VPAHHPVQVDAALRHRGRLGRQDARAGADVGRGQRHGPRAAADAFDRAAVGGAHPRRPTVGPELQRVGRELLGQLGVARRQERRHVARGGGARQLGQRGLELDRADDRAGGAEAGRGRRRRAVLRGLFGLGQLLRRQVVEGLGLLIGRDDGVAAGRLRRQHDGASDDAAVVGAQAGRRQPDRQDRGQRGDRANPRARHVLPNTDLDHVEYSSRNMAMDCHAVENTSTTGDADGRNWPRHLEPS